MKYVTYEDFNNMDMRLGRIRFVEPVPETDKLLRFEIDFGAQDKPVINCTGSCEVSSDIDCEKCDQNDSSTRCEIHCECEPKESSTPFGKQEYQGRDIRQIVSGVREFFPEYETLVGKYGLYILNLEPRNIRGVMSHGMLMAVDGVNGEPVFLEPRGEVEPGAKIR